MIEKPTPERDPSKENPNRSDNRQRIFSMRSNEKTESATVDKTRENSSLGLEKGSLNQLGFYLSDVFVNEEKVQFGLV